MSVSHRVTGTWAELTADGSVAIPATPQVGDRMYLFARWKDFSVTATVANWTAVLTPFADGAVGTGNGTGSVKVGCWYRDWQSGDTDPTIDFSAAPENASVVITVMAKGADDVWLTPVAVTAAMTNWTTSPQIVAASSTADVLGGGVVMGLIGIRDDTATMTRPSTGIDDSAAAVTWNGNYVESPATHHSTTTGDDGASDLGYRLVTTGASATLRMTGTISAAETGAALWVVQGVSIQVTPSNAALATATFGPSLRLAATPTTASLVTASFAPKLDLTHTPSTLALTVASFAPVLNLSTIPSTVSFVLTAFAPQLHEQVTPVTASLTISPFAPSLSLLLTVIPATSDLAITPQSVSLSYGFILSSASLVTTTFRPSVLPFNVIFLDPGGDAVQAPDYFHTHVGGTGSDIVFDTAQQVESVGSYRFDSNTNEDPTVALNDVLSSFGEITLYRRISFYWRYDSVPDAAVMVTEFFEDEDVYSGGGFDDPSFTNADDGLYATATPARNAGQGSRTIPITGTMDIPVSAVIDLVKIIYERKYDVDTSIGISRVKWIVNSEEGPDHDNTDMPLTDTVVEVDVTGDRTWEWQEFVSGAVKVVAEARRGDTDTEHTQSWDYVKMEVEYHLATVIIASAEVAGNPGFRIAITPKGAHSVIRFVDGAGVGYDGITNLPINTWNRISFGYVVHDTDDLEIRVFVNGIPELWISEASTGGVPLSPDLHYGWLRTPGIDHKCWFTQFAIDDGDDLQDPGNILSTHKGAAAVNEDNWNTVGGTGAVNERPLSETNYVEELEGIVRQRQSYTLQAVDEGDLDISSKTLIGYLGWSWARVSSAGEPVDLIVNNVLFDRTAAISAGGAALLLTAGVTSTEYPSHAAGIGMRNAPELLTTTIYECGVIQAYEGPLNPDILLERQLVNNEILATIIDDLRADPPDSYEVCCQFDDFGGSVEIVVHSLDQDGGSVQFQGTLHSTGRMRITPGVEVTLDVTVVGVTMLTIWRRINID